jgi:hypothetical protein
MLMNTPYIVLLVFTHTTHFSTKTFSNALASKYIPGEGFCNILSNRGVKKFLTKTELKDGNGNIEERCLAQQ